MFEANALIEKAKTSKFYLKMLNFTLSRIIPFNRPHAFRVMEINENSIKVSLPYRRVNLNHIRGLHACALATVSEFSTGLLLLNELDTSKYRIILKNLQMDYHYQGKMNAIASYSLSQEWVRENIHLPLEDRDSTVVTCEVKVHDVEGNHLTTGHVHWQIKLWQKVKTPINES